MDFLEFFAGSGLVAEGLKAHFSPIWANDIDPKKRAIYTANHGDQHFRLGSINDVSGVDLPPAHLAWASFPCQDLSLAGKMAGLAGERSGTVWQWLRVMDEMSQPPAILVAENVLGLVAAEQGAHYRELHEALRQRGYRVGAIVLDAARWVPQSRPRVFVVAVAKSAVLPSMLVSASPTWLHPESVLRAVRGLQDWVWWHLPAPENRPAALEDVIEWDAAVPEDGGAANLNIIPARHRRLLDAMPSRRSAAPGYRRTREGRQVLELRFDGLAGCLRTPEGGSSRQLLVIRDGAAPHCRLLTVRETARLMGAPDSYQIPGSYNDGYKAMGDGVAVPVARYLAEHLLAPLARHLHGQQNPARTRGIPAVTGEHTGRSGRLPVVDAQSASRRRAATA